MPGPAGSSLGLVMNGTMGRVLFWTPRIACIAFAAFLAVFALDALSEPVGVPRKVLGLVMHLIPSGIVLLALAAAWWREWLGAVLFPLLAVLHLRSAWGRLDGWGYLLIEGPLLLLGILFLISWWISRQSARRLLD